MMGIVIGILVLLLIIVTPIGIDCKWADTKVRFKIQIGFLFFSLPKRKEVKEKKKSIEKAVPKESPKKKRITLDDIWYLLSKSKRLLRLIVKGFKVRKFRLHVVAGGRDPATTAKLYGMMCAVSSAVLPIIHSWKPKYRLDLNLNSPVWQVSGSIRVNIRIGRVLRIACAGALLAISWLLRGRRRVSATI
jgi:ABC-type Fe3+-siderophore transport system permease subunit